MYKNLPNHTKVSVDVYNAKEFGLHTKKQRRKVNKNVKSNRSHPQQRHQNLIGGKSRTKSICFEIDI